MEVVPVGENACRFDETKLEEVLKKVIRRSLGDENAPMADPNERSPGFCPVFVVATDAENATGTPKLFRSYGKNRDQCPIWQAARATSAAPTFFPPMKIKLPPPGGFYIDGGIRYNNPSEVALDEVRVRWKRSRQFFIVSIGTGFQDPADFLQNPESSDGDSDSDSAGKEVIRKASVDPVVSPSPGQVSRAIQNVIFKVGDGIKTASLNLPFTGHVQKLARFPGGVMTLRRFAQELVTLSTNSEAVHDKMHVLSKSHDPFLRFPYYRFNVQIGLNRIGLQEWKRKTKMGALTRGYLGEHSVMQAIEECAESLFKKVPFEST
jgi:predicted acylesterase/phospholipase RssA